jgi:hypothetical protein
MGCMSKAIVALTFAASEKESKSSDACGGSTDQRIFRRGWTSIGPLGIEGELTISVSVRFAFKINKARLCYGYQKLTAV